jgi:hypothetical protein
LSQLKIRVELSLYDGLPVRRTLNFSCDKAVDGTLLKCIFKRPKPIMNMKGVNAIVILLSIVVALGFPVLASWAQDTVVPKSSKKSANDATLSPLIQTPSAVMVSGFAEFWHSTYGKTTMLLCSDLHRRSGLD